MRITSVKLSKDLNCYNPDNAQYLDYIERTLYNQIIGSLNPDQYQTCYQYAVGLNATKPFGNETPQSTCCGGTGSENHTKYQQSAYFANDHTLLGRSLYANHPSLEGEGRDHQAGLSVAGTAFSHQDNGRRGRFHPETRVPYWATQGFSIKVNGKEVAKSYQPSTYVELEQKHWKVGDVVEIDMPFSKHIEYGADKLSSDVASMDGTPLKTSWVGTLMYGPLVMAGTGAQTWNQATLNIDSRLSKITVGESNGVTTGAGANLLTLKLDGKEFQPDYYRNANSTHYYRINLTDAKSKKSKKVKIDFTELNSLLNLAAERKADQEKWNALSQKVPEYAPWAPFGYERMQKVMAQAQELVAKGKKKVTLDELEGTTAILNRAINTMRPGNLAEMEDLRELSGLLRRAGWPDDNTSEELKEAISYGRMVQKYVTDGSGTHDMIHAAVGKLKKAMKQ